MLWQVIGSSSSGNGSVLYDDNEALIIECGFPLKKVVKALNYNISHVVACLCSHEHGDHAKYIAEYERAGFRMLKPWEKYERKIKVGSFIIYPFDLVHNVPTFGFYIESNKTGKIIYATDTCYVRYKFPEVRHIFIECNWDKDYVDTESAKYQHELTAHMSKDVCMNFIKVNCTNKLRTVVLCHLSDSAIDAESALAETKEIVNSNVLVDYAAAGKEWELTDRDKCPFM